MGFEIFPPKLGILRIFKKSQMQVLLNNFGWKIFSSKMHLYVKIIFLQLNVFQAQTGPKNRDLKIVQQSWVCCKSLKSLKSHFYWIFWAWQTHHIFVFIRQSCRKMGTWEYYSHVFMPDEFHILIFFVFNGIFNLIQEHRTHYLEL